MSVTPKYSLPFAWCPECEHQQIQRTIGLTCPQCRSTDNRNVTMKTMQQLETLERQTVHLQSWMREVRAQGLRGFSPGGAASELGCHRSMIDKLVDSGVLEKSVYNERGHFIVYISKRSIDLAKESKRRTGKWTKIAKVEDAAAK